jgi:O-antigen ligase
MAFVFLQLRLLKATHEAYRFAGNWFGKGISIGIFAGTIALVIHSLGTVSFIIVRIMEPYWFLVALAVVVRALAIEEYVRQRQRKQQQPAVATQPAPRPVPA